LGFFGFFEKGSHYVAQAGLKLFIFLGVGIAGVHHYAQ
jgi:hypothetical protein